MKRVLSKTKNLIFFELALLILVSISAFFYWNLISTVGATSGNNAVLIIGITNSLSLVLTVWLYYLLSITNREKEQFRTILQAIQIPLSVTRLEDGKILYANEPMGATLGICSQNLLTEQATSFYRNAVERSVLLQKLAEEKYIHNHEIRAKKADGVDFSALISAELIEFKGEQAIVSTFCDITEYKQVESALRENESRLKGILDNSPANIYLKDPQGRYILSSRQYEIQCNLSKEQVIGKTDHEIFPQETAKQFALHDQKVLEAVKPIEFEEILPGENSLSVYKSIKFPVFDPEGRLCGVGGISTDISDYRQAQEKLRKSEERFRIALKNSPILVFHQDTELRYTWVYNPKLPDNASQVIGKLDSDVMSSEDATRLTAIKRRVLTTGIGTREEISIKVKGEEHYWDLTVEPLRSQNGEIRGVTCATTNITELRLREQRLRAIFERVLDAIVITDKQGVYIEANPAACKLFGLPHDQLVGSRVSDFLEPGLDCQRAWQTFLQKGEAAGELKLLRPDGEVRIVEYAATANFIPGRHLSVLHDISYRVQAEEALQESEALFHTIANSAPVLMCMSDKHNLCTFFNQPWLDFTGRTLEQELGNGWIEGIHPEDLEHFRHNYLSTCQAQNLFRFEYRLRRADTQYRWMLCTGVPRYTTEGTFIGYIYSCIDITDRKEAEEERRRSEARYRAIVEDQTELICRFRPDGSLLFVNEAYCRYFGKKRQELVETDFCCLSLDRNRQQIESYIAALTPENPMVTNEEVVTTADEENYWLQWINRGVFSEQGELVELQAVGRDITERKHTEEALREHQLFVEGIADATPGILYIYDLIRQRHVYINQQITELLGYTPAQVQEMGKNFTDQVIHPTDLPKYQEYIKRRIPQAKDGEILEFDYRVRHANGEWRWLQNRDTIFIRNELGCPIQIIGVAQDITKRKQAESALQASEERLRVALEAAGMSSWEWNLLTDQITWSGNFDFFSSMLPSSFDGKHETFIESIHSPDRYRVLEALENAVNDGEDYDVEFRVILPDGNIRWVASKGQVFYGETGFAVRMVGVDMDVTRHKLAEEELQRSEELYRTMARNFPNGAVLLFDKDLRYTLAEGKGLADFDLSKGLVEGKTISEVFPPEIWHYKQPADREALEGKSSVFEMSYGNKIYLVHVLPVKNDRGEIFAGMAMWQDISDRKRAELALLEERNFISAILNTANAIILVLDPEGRIHRFNRFCEKLTGYTFEEVKGKFAWDLFLLEDDVEPVKAVVRELKSGKFANEYENYWVARDGTRRLLSWSNTVLLDADGSVKYVVAIAIDVTERKKAEKVRQALERERELSQLRLRFFSMASHEFRTPLSTILMSAQLLATCSDGWPQEKRARNLQRIESATKHMIQLLEDILMINRAETRRLELQPAQINLSKFCWHLVEEMQLNAASNQQVVFKCQCRCHKAYIDEKVLRSILTNLLSNALKYSPDGSDVYLDLTCEKGQATLQIKDEGIGIPESDQALLFEAFHRGGNIEQIGGTGLGLTVVKHCVQLCGGSINFKSEVGVGTTFTVKIPLNQDMQRDSSSEL